MSDVIYQYQQGYVPSNGNAFYFWVDCTKEFHDEEASEGGKVRTLYATAQPVSEQHEKIADDLESLLWPNMASGNKEIINAAIQALRVTSVQTVSDDTRRMDYLVSKVVNVREPLLYGSHSIFWSQAITDEEDDHYESKLREQIDAMLAAEPGGQNE